MRSAEAWDLLGWLADRAGATDDAEQALRAAAWAADRRAYTRAFLRLRAHLERQRRWDDILALCDDARGRAGPAFVNYYRAAPLAELGRSAEALAALNRAKDDATFDSRREKARVLGILGRFDAMRQECAALLDTFTRPEEVRSVRYLLADAYLGLKRWDEAEAELRGVIEDDPDDALALNNLGYNLADQNRKLAEAEDLICRAIEIDRDERARAGAARLENAAYLDSLGWVRFRRGDLADARNRLEQAAALPDGAADPTVWDHLGDVCFRLGDKPAAADAWRKAAERYVGTHQGRHLGRRDEVLRKRKLTE